MKKKVKILFGVLLGLGFLAATGVIFIFYGKNSFKQSQQSRLNNLLQKEKFSEDQRRAYIKNQEKKFEENKQKSVYQLQSYLLKIFDNSNLAIIKKMLEDFYQENYAKLLNRDLKKFYFDWKEKIFKQLEEIELEIEWIQNLKYISNNTYFSLKSSFDFQKFEKLGKLIVDWKKDAWIVFEPKDAIDVSDFQHMIGSKNDRRQMLYCLLERIISVEKNQSVSLITEKNLVWELNKKNIQLTNVLKKILPTLISRKWDFEKQVKVLFRFLAFKNEYYGYQKDPNESTDEWYLKDAKQVDFSGVLKEESTRMDCKGYSLFMYGTLQALGYRNIGFESEYYENDGKERVPHVNVWVVVDGIKYVVDATYADQFRNDWDYEEWHEIDSHFLTEKQYLKKHNYQIRENSFLDFREYYQDPYLL